MTIIDRLKLELNDKEYLTDANYVVMLTENGLTSTETYDKPTMQKQLLYTVIDILEMVSNDVDVMRKVETEFSNTSDAYKHLQERISSLRDRIATISDVTNEYSQFTLMYTRR